MQSTSQVRSDHHDRNWFRIVDYIDLFKMKQSIFVVLFGVVVNSSEYRCLIILPCFITSHSLLTRVKGTNSRLSLLNKLNVLFYFTYKEATSHFA